MAIPPLEAIYAIVFFDALRVKIRDEGTVGTRPCTWPSACCPGQKEVLGLWIEQTEGAKFWLRVMTELQNRGVRHPDRGGRWAEGFPRGDQLGVSAGGGADLHRAPDPLLDAVRVLERSQGRRRRAQADLPRRFRSLRHASALEAFDAGPGAGNSRRSRTAWRRNWEQVIPFFAFPPAVRQILYTTNAIESLNGHVEAVRVRGHFPSEESATKLLWLVLREIARDWKMPPITWHAARAQFAILFGDRFDVTR